eukprot:428895_1
MAQIKVVILLISCISQSSANCNTTMFGSTIEHGFEDIRIDLSSLPNNQSQVHDSFITFSTCSQATDFDTHLFLYNTNKTVMIDSCDDYCIQSSQSVMPCIENVNTKLSPTVWDLPVYNLTRTNYTLHVTGYEDEVGSYALTISYDCDYHVPIMLEPTRSPSDEPTPFPSHGPSHSPSEQPTPGQTTAIMPTTTSLVSSTTASIVSSLTVSLTDDVCDEDYPCPFRLLGIYPNDYNASVFYYFYINVSTVDGILRRSNWDMEVFNLYNARSEQVLPYVLSRTDGFAQGYNETISATQLQKDDMISFVDTDVFCDGRLCSSIEYIEPHRLNLIAVIVTVSVMCCCALCMYVGVGIKINDPRGGAFTVAINNKNTSQVLKIVMQILISGCSIIGSLALSDSLGLSNFDNGVLAVAMGTVTLLLVCCRGVWAYGASEKKEYKGTLRTNAQDNDIALSITIFIATIVDATFDIFQGIAAITEQEYTSLTASILVTATWLGVGEEILEGAFEIVSSIVVDGCGECSDGHPHVTQLIYFIIMISAKVELCMGIYLFSTFSDDVYVGVGIAIQSLFLLFSVLWTCFELFLQQQ